MELISAFLGGCFAVKWLGGCSWLPWWALLLMMFLKCTVFKGVSIVLFDTERS